MSYKVMVLAPSASGKSTLMRYLRTHTELKVAEMDEEVLKANDNTWPADDNYKNQVLVPRISERIIQKSEVVYIASYVPTKLIKKARREGFTILLLQLDLAELKKRNKERMVKEKYGDVSKWFEMQQSGYSKLQEDGLVDKTIDGKKSTAEIAEEVISFANSWSPLL